MIAKATSLRRRCPAPEARLAQPEWSTGTSFRRSKCHRSLDLSSCEAAIATCRPDWHLLSQHVRSSAPDCAPSTRASISFRTNRSIPLLENPQRWHALHLCLLNIHAKTCFTWYGVFFLQIFRYKNSSYSHKVKNHCLYSRPSFPGLPSVRIRGLFFFFFTLYIKF